MNAQEQAVVNLYHKGRLSFAGVARKMGMCTSTVQDAMRRCAPQLIRNQNEWRNPQMRDFSLRDLGLIAVGRCKSCKCEIVSNKPGKGQTCALCRAAA